MSLIDVPGGKIWAEYRGPESTTALIAIHGGPAFSGFYLTPLYDLSDQFGVVTYDQLGCGRSPCSYSEDLWTVSRFTDELESLRLHFGFDRLILHGHSWGAVIASEYTRRSPDNVDKLILASPAISIPLWREDIRRLTKKLPLIDQMVLGDGERSGNFHSERYLEAVDKFYSKHIYGMEEIPSDLQASVNNSNPKIYNYMWGPNELVVNGTLKDYDLRPRLNEIRCPTLFTCGRLDEASPETCEILSGLITDSSVVVFEDSAHHPQWSERDRYMSILREFISSY